MGDDKKKIMNRPNRDVHAVHPFEFNTMSEAALVSIHMIYVSC
jgi:hypothetical protein